MSEATDFRVGERVVHVHMGNGEVIEADEVVRVKYDEWAGVCAYDADWFRAHPKYLFHRHPPERELDENVRRSGEALRQRTVTTPDDIKGALQAVAAALAGNADALDEYRKLREYIGFLQLTCAVNIAAVESHGLQKAERP